MLDSLSLCYSRLRYMLTQKKMLDMSNLDLIPKHVNDMNDKCVTRMQTKISRKPFPKIERTSTLLQIIHSNVCDLHSTPTRGGNKYFVTFIDGYSRFCYVYLMHTKDEVLDKFKIYKNEVKKLCETKIKYLISDRG